MTNREIAQEISNRIGTAPVPFDSVYSIALEIYHQLGGEESQFDSVYSILLEILPLVEGGGSGKAIEEVDALPEASENKEKFYRLSSDDNVYVSELKSRTTITTNRLPDEQQIDKAYIYTNDDEPSYYKGMYHIIANDGEVDGYMWYQEIDGGDYIILSLKNAVLLTNSDSVSDFFQVSGEEIQATIDEETKTVTLGESYSLSNLDDCVLGDGQYIIPATYNAPESAQIGNATLDNSGFGYTGVYDGTQVTFIDTDGSGEQVTGYKWKVDGQTDIIATSKPASEIYYYYDGDSDETYTDVKVWVVSDGLYESFICGIESDGLNIPQLNAPDSEQVDNAYIETDYLGSDASFEYKGSCILHLTDGDVTAYKWTSDNQYAANVVFVSTVPASDIYSLNTKIWEVLTTDDSEWSGNESTLRDSTEYTGNYISQSYFEDRLFVGNEMISNYSTVKYQRTETIEEWDWEDIVKPAIIDVEDLPETIDNSNKGNIYRIADDATYMAVNYDGVWGWDAIATQTYVDNVIPTINVNADLIYNQDMTINSIDNVEYHTSTGEELSEIGLAASINANFIIKVSGMQMGTVSAIGTFSRYFVDMGPVQNNLIRFTLPFMNLVNQSQDTLFMEYDGNDDTWTVRLQGA